MFILSENFILGENCYIGLQRSKGIQKKVIVLFLTIITGGLYQNPFSFYLSCSTASWICEDLCCSGLNCLKLLVFQDNECYVLKFTACLVAFTLLQTLKAPVNRLFFFSSPKKACETMPKVVLIRFYEYCERHFAQQTRDGKGRKIIRLEQFFQVALEQHTPRQL